MRFILASVSVILAALAFTFDAVRADGDSGTTLAPEVIPLRVTRNPRFGTYKASIMVAIGNLKALPIGFDTGSAGLHVFAAVPLQSPGSGVQCSTTPTTFTVGNPGRITYSGVMCAAPLHFGNVATPISVPFAYLTSAKCTDSNPGCRIADLNNPRAQGGEYGVFGAGITGGMPVINPILTLPPPYRSVFSIELTPRGGQLVLGKAASHDAVAFPLAKGVRAGVRWDKGESCLFINGHPTTTCLAVSFDTGNGVPWIRDSDVASIPQSHGLVAPSTRIGFAPPGATSEATSVVAGTSFADSIKLEYTDRLPLTNTGIAAFFGHIFTYDNVNGTISIASAP